MKKLTAILLCAALALCLCVPALADEGFNAGLEISEVQNDSFTVTVPESNNAILAEKKPVLSVRCPDGWTDAAVTFDGSTLDSTFENGSVSFTVEKGGVYTIAKANSGGSETPPDSGSSPATETETNPDGSTTTTVTNPDGSTRETTTASDGSTATVDKAPDGSVTGASAAVSAAAAAEAAESGTPVTLPVELSAAEDAPELRIDLPGGTSSLKVEIPVDGVTESDVVVLVHPDGTEEILPKTALSEDGLVVELEDGDTVKIVRNESEFVDLPEADWAETSIRFVTSRGLFNGVDSTHFAPEDGMNRAMLATVLYRMERKPEAEKAADFDDVEEGRWYSDAIAWAAEAGIVEGYGESFGTDDPVTREQLAVMLWRLRGKPAASSATEAGASGWAVEAMSWAVEVGLIRGNGSDYRAKDPATRAETAAILMRFINL